MKAQGKKRSGTSPKRGGGAKRAGGSLPRFDPNPSAKLASELLTAEGIPHAPIGRIAMWTLLPSDRHELTKGERESKPIR